MVESLSDRELLARLLLAEAGNQGYEGKLAVGSVIGNRAASGRYGETIRDVMLRPGQFSPLNSYTGYAGGEGGVDINALQPSEEEYTIADMILSGQYDDPTGGATHFYNPDLASPSWGPAEEDEWRRIGGHIFGQADATLPSEVLMRNRVDAMVEQGVDRPLAEAAIAREMSDAENTQEEDKGSLDALSDALAYLDLSGIMKGQQYSFNPPGVYRPRGGSGASALKRLGLASLV